MVSKKRLEAEKEGGGDDLAVLTERRREEESVRQRCGFDECVFPSPSPPEWKVKRGRKL